MPRMKKTMKAADAPGKDLPKIPVELIDYFVTGPMRALVIAARLLPDLPTQPVRRAVHCSLTPA